MMTLKEILGRSGRKRRRKVCANAQRFQERKWQPGIVYGLLADVWGGRGEFRTGYTVSLFIGLFT